MKHVGRHGDKKVAVLWRVVPDEQHMCLVSYSDKLPRLYHDTLMKVLESEQGQQAKELAEVLHRNLLPDGRNLLNTLHKEGLIKKVPNNQVIMTPDTRNSVRLDELNSILQQMSEGEAAVRRLAEMDAQSGLRDPKKLENIPASIRTADALSDSAIAKNLRDQAQRMQQEAQSLLAESQRLQAEAEQLDADVAVQVTQVQEGRKAKKTPVARRRRSNVATTA
jgi:hypothetical protein